MLGPIFTEGVETRVLANAATNGDPRSGERGYNGFGEDKLFTFTNQSEPGPTSSGPTSCFLFSQRAYNETGESIEPNGADSSDRSQNSAADSARIAG